MSILIYSEERNAHRAQFLETIQERFTSWGIESCTGMDELRERLRERIYEVDAGVLLIATEMELETLFSLAPAITSLPLILILPDPGHDLFSKAIKLWPRYVAYAQNGFGDVVSVIAKLLERAKRNRKADGSSQIVISDVDFKEEGGATNDGT